MFGTAGPPAKVIHASLDHRLHGGWSMDYQALPPVDMLLAAEPDAVVGALLDALQARPAKPKAEPRPFAIETVPPGTLRIAQLAHGLRQTKQARLLNPDRSVPLTNANNNVTLRGTVKDDDEARLVEGLVRITPGVGAIKNELAFPVAAAPKNDFPVIVRR